VSKSQSIIIRDIEMCCASKDKKTQTMMQNGKDAGHVQDVRNQSMRGIQATMNVSKRNAPCGLVR
jgi:hypothetical protein